MSNLSTLDRQAVRPVPVSDPLEQLRERFADVQVWVGGWSREFLAIVRGRLVVARSAASLELLLAELCPEPVPVQAHPRYDRHAGGWVTGGR